MLQLSLFQLFSSWHLQVWRWPSISCSWVFYYNPWEYLLDFLMIFSFRLLDFLINFSSRPHTDNSHLNWVHPRGAVLVASPSSMLHLRSCYCMHLPIVNNGYIITCFHRLSAVLTVLHPSDQHNTWGWWKHPWTRHFSSYMDIGRDEIDGHLNRCLQSEHVPFNDF